MNTTTVFNLVNNTSIVATGKEGVTFQMPEELVARIYNYGVFCSDGFPVESKVSVDSLSYGDPYLVKGVDAVVLFEHWLNKGTWEERVYDKDSGDYEDLYNPWYSAETVNLIFEEGSYKPLVSAPLWDEDGQQISSISSGETKLEQVSGINGVIANLMGYSKVYGYSSFEGEMGFLFHFYFLPSITTVSGRAAWESSPTTKRGAYIQGGKMQNLVTMDGEQPRGQKKGTESKITPTTTICGIATLPYQGKSFNWGLPVPTSPKVFNQSQSLEHRWGAVPVVYKITDSTEAEKTARPGYKARKLRKKRSKGTSAGQNSPLGAKGRRRVLEDSKYRVIPFNTLLMLEFEDKSSVVFAQTQPYLWGLDDLTGEPKYAIALISVDCPQISKGDYLKLYRQLQSEVNPYVRRELGETNLAMEGVIYTSKPVYLELMKAHGYNQSTLGGWYPPKTTQPDDDEPKIRKTPLSLGVNPEVNKLLTAQAVALTKMQISQWKLVFGSSRPKTRKARERKVLAAIKSGKVTKRVGMSFLK